MKTIALRFSDKFAPVIGTIAAHKDCIKAKGYVWYGKLGSPVSDKVCKAVLENKDPRVLLIHSGKTSRYWAHIDQITRETPALDDIPEYYRDRAESFSTWFRMRRIEDAEKDVMANCIVVSSQTTLSRASRHSMCPFFIIEYVESGEKNENI